MILEQDSDNLELEVKPSLIPGAGIFFTILIYYKDNPIGMGLFAKTSFNPGDFIIEYRGLVFLDNGGSNPNNDLERDPYLFGITLYDTGGNTTTPAFIKASNAAKYINDIIDLPKYLNYNKCTKVPPTKLKGKKLEYNC